MILSVKNLGKQLAKLNLRVYFSPNVEKEARESLCDILGFHSTSLIGKYLGIPIKTPGSSTQDFNFVLDRVKKKLVGWKANLISSYSSFALYHPSLHYEMFPPLREGLGPN